MTEKSGPLKVCQAYQMDVKRRILFSIYHLIFERNKVRKLIFLAIPRNINAHAQLSLVLTSTW